MKNGCAKLVMAIAATCLVLPGMAISGSREDLDLEMADQAILSSLVYERSAETRTRCARDRYSCAHVDPAELGLSLIAARTSQKSITHLGSLLRYRLDGGLSESYTCNVLTKGGVMTQILAKLDEKALQRQCQGESAEFYRRYKGMFAAPTDVCASVENIAERRNELLLALKGGKKCQD